jgi:hypothetical protein
LISLQTALTCIVLTLLTVPLLVEARLEALLCYGIIVLSWLIL